MAITAATRRELTDAVMERYQGASAGERSRILDEFVALTGFHRKHAIRVLNTKEDTPKTSTAIARVRPRLYDEAVRQAVVVLWEASDRICGKRLRPLIPILVAALEKHGHMKLDDAVRSRVLTASASTLDRVLREPRAAASGRKRRRRPAAGGVRQSVPIRTFADWKEPVPGFLEVDLVAHCGESAAGSFANTLVLTDIASGWTECVALIVRESSLVVDALERLRETMPFPLRGIDTDNGSEFVNEVLLAYCTEKQIEFTRSRPYRKNDQAWVEQKNGAIVRRMVGYGRLEGIAAGHALARLYGVSIVRELLPTLVQARGEETDGSPREQAVPRPRNASRAPPHKCVDRTRHEGATAGGVSHAGSSPPPRRDSDGAAPPRRACGWRHDPRAPSSRCRPRGLSEEPGSGLACWRGAPDSSCSREARPPLADASRPLRDRVASNRDMARDGA